MPNNNFKPFSIGGGANVLTQGQYEALTTIIANGFSAGTALSPQLNKVWRQSSIMAAVLGALINDVTGQDAIDDGTTTTLEQNIFAAILKAGYAADSGAVNAYAVTLAPAVPAYYDGMIVGFSTANANTSTTPTLNVNGLGAISLKQSDGTALVIGQIHAGAYCQAVYRSAGPRFEVTTGRFALADGTNATGTWPIGINGVAANATNATNAVNATNATGSAVVTGAISSSSPTAGIGYATGAGGSVSQTGNISTDVTLNKITGLIHCVSASLTAGQIISFNVINSTFVLGDTITYLGNKPTVFVVTSASASASGTFTLTVQVLQTSTVQLDIYFNIIKGSIN